MSNIIKHRFSNEPPSASEIAVGELVLQLFKNEAVLYTKSLNGEVLELGKGALNLEELQDLDLTNLKDGSFLIRQGDKFVASNFIGSISNLTDVEINNPQSGDYMRYDSVFLSFRNFKPSYNLYQLLDVSVPNPAVGSASSGMNDQTLYYDHTAGKFKTRLRHKFITQLDDVELSSQEANQILQLDTDGIWKNMNLQIVRDTNPALGGNLNAQGYHIVNSSYKINTVLCNTPTKTIAYADGDYWILEGVPVATNEQCIVNIDFTTTLTNTVCIMMLEIRQNTGNILISGLPNLQYEDGKPLQLSGAGKIDLITITAKKVGTQITTYVTPTALNLATIGNGGVPAYRYDKNRYTDVQLFSNPTLYDDYFEHVKLLLNFEEEVISNKLWYEDKSDLDNPVTTTTTQTAIDVFSYGMQEKVAEFVNATNNITITPTVPITLTNSFTFECFINHPSTLEYTGTNMEHVLFRNTENTLVIKYKGDVNTTQNTYLEVRVLDYIYTYVNGYNYFRDKNAKYIHIAVVRKTNSPILALYVDGVYQMPLMSVGLADIMSDIVISGADITGFQGLLNTVRITNYARYHNNFVIPDMRFGLVGGAVDILDAQVFDTYMYLDKELEYNIFC